MSSSHTRGVLVAGIGAAHVSGRPAAEIRRLLVLARGGDPHLVGSYVDVMLQITRALYADDDVGEALRAAQSAVEIARADEELLVPALGVLALVRLLAGDDEQAAADAREAIEHPDAAQRAYGHIAASAVLAIIDARAGRRHSARGHADRALKEARRVGLQGLPAAAPALLADAVTAALEGRLVRGSARRPAGGGGGDRRRRLAGVGAARARPDRAAARPPTRRRGNAGTRRGAARRGPRRGCAAGARLRRCGTSSTPGAAATVGRAAVAGRAGGPAAAATPDGARDRGERSISLPTRSSHISARSTASSVSTRARMRSRAATALGLLDEATSPTTGQLE